MLPYNIEFVTEERSQLRKLVQKHKPKPFLKWAGGKKQLLQNFELYIPSAYGRFIEPFVGGGALFFHLLPRRALLADANCDLIETYEVVRDSPLALMRALRKHVNERDYYYEIRAQTPKDLSKVQRAARFIYLNKTCYNGLHRVNMAGTFNVPFGSYKRPTICDAPALKAASQALQRKTLRCGDFEAVTRGAKPGDFVYMDPPYHPVSRTASFTAYHKTAFGEDEQRRLANVYASLDRKGCKVMLSNSDTSVIRELYGDYRKVRLKAKRSINSKANKRGPVSELLILNYYEET